ncbi:MAG: NAD(P)/FAD-dependent oxidoreductase [Desulfobacterales bacterium]
MDVEATIIGAGVVGLAVAARLSQRYKHVFVIEKNDRFGQETSSRNSEVIHAGIYYPPDSLKARLCVEGRQMLYALCGKKRIPFRKCGKLIVATGLGEEGFLAAIQEKARANGVADLQMVSAAQLARMEPAVDAVSALFSPSTGIIHSHRLMRHFAAQAQKNGARFVYRCDVTRVEPLAGPRYRVHVRYPDGQTEKFTSRYLVNCAGLNSDRIAAGMGIDIRSHRYEQFFWKGEYFSVALAPQTLNHLVYPVPLPNNEGLGIHATFDLSGRVKLGPNAVFLPQRSVDYSVDAAHRPEFFMAARRYLKALTLEDLAPDYAGIRPKLQKPGDAVRDFIIREESAQGLPGLVNLIGIESPGLTASPAIAEFVASLLP